MLRAHTKALQLVLLLATFTAHTTVAVCPGFDFAIGNLQRVGDGVTSWTVFDDSCNVVDGLITGGNPCEEGIFGCSPPPILFDEYVSTVTGQRYACRTDPNSGTCNGTVISVCCSNGGN